MDIQRTLRALADRQSITELLYAYCDRFDRNDPQGVAALFTADAVIDYNPDTPNILGADLAHTISEGLNTTFAATSHHISNVIVTLESEDSAYSLCYVDAWHRYRDGSPDGFLWGRYCNRFVREEQGWKISGMLLQGAGTSNFHRARMHGIGRQ